MKLTYCEMTLEMFTKTYSINPIIVAIDIPVWDYSVRCCPWVMDHDRLAVSAFGEPYPRWDQTLHLHLTCNFLGCILELLQRRLLERRSYKVPLLPYEDRSEEFKAIGSAFKQNFALQRHLAISFILTFMAPRAFSVGR